METYENGHDMVTNFNCKHIMEEESLVEAGGRKEDTDMTLYLNGKMYMLWADILWKTRKYVTKGEQCHP